MNIVAKMLDLPFTLTTPVTSFFVEMEAGFLRLHWIGFTTSEKIKYTFILLKIYPRLPAIVASITWLSDNQVMVRYIQEKVIKAVELMSRDTCERGEFGDPRPTSGSWTTKSSTLTYSRRLVITDSGGSERRTYRNESAGATRGMTTADGEDGSYPLNTKKCVRCFAIGHDVEHCLKPDMWWCYTCNLTRHNSRNCQQFRTQGKAINTILKNKFDLHPILDTGAAISLVPDIRYLRYPTKINTNEMIKLIDSTILPLNYRGTQLNMGKGRQTYP